MWLDSLWLPVLQEVSWHLALMWKGLCGLTWLWQCPGCWSQPCRGSRFSKSLEGNILRPLCTLEPACFVAVNVEKSRRGRWLNPPSRSGWHPRGILGGAVLHHSLGSTQCAGWGSGGRAISPLLTQPEGEHRGDEIPRLSVQTGERNAVCL